MELLEVGDEPTARAELTAYRRSVPNSSLAKDLIAQIDRPVDEYFPTEYQVITLKPGQTLSNVSQTYLGSAYKFYALAKYNKISKPRRVVPGQSIKIPLTSSAKAAFEDDDSNEADVIVDERSIAEQLETDDEIQEELENVVETEAVQLEPGTVDPDAAFEVDSEVADSEPMDGVDPVEIPIDSEVEAEGALVGSEELVDEIDQAEQLTEDTVDDAAAELMARQQEVSQLHRSAISAYRAQDLDKAIALWNEVLLLDPEHEGAQIYREQAVSLKQRLDSLN
ncbi:MAG: LysM domain-containing protein [Pseudomonadota bacterium]